LIGLVAALSLARSSKARAWTRACRMRIRRAAAECDCGMKWNGCSDCLDEQELKMIDQLRRTHPDVHGELLRELAHSGTAPRPS
jgi:diadenosine tetraphosphatase ApaH/serine/threonine PP2A family protein phosphatase